MTEILEQYGSSLLELIATLAVMVIIFGCVTSGGVISDIVADYMLTICG